MPNILFSSLPRLASYLAQSHLQTFVVLACSECSGGGPSYSTPHPHPISRVGWGAGGPGYWLTWPPPPPSPHMGDPVLSHLLDTSRPSEGYLPFQGRSLTDFLAPSLSTDLGFFFLPLPPLSPGLLTTRSSKAPLGVSSPPTPRDKNGDPRVEESPPCQFHACARLSPLEAPSWEGEAVAGVDTPQTSKSSIFWHLPLH